MIEFLPITDKDGYKADHMSQYPKLTKVIYANMTPRGSRLPGVKRVVAFSYQALVKDFFVRQFNQNFFEQKLDKVVNSYRRRMANYLGPNKIGTDHIANLHQLGYLPLLIKAVPEGTLVPLRVPCLTIRNVGDGDFFWLPNMFETKISNAVWQPMTNATVGFGYRQSFEYFAKITGAAKDFIKFQGHDFSYRGMPGQEAAMASGAAHLLSFVGTDTIPAIDYLEEFYGANSDEELVGCSVPATEHSVMSAGGEDGELATIRRLITEVYKEGIVSIVWDTWNFWEALIQFIPELKNDILQRDGKVVIRPDSGDPVEILCGKFNAYLRGERTPEAKGLIEYLWDIFGGTVNAAGFKELDPHIGAIYGDSITQGRQQMILEGLAAKGFASSNIVLGIGSYTYQYNTRDTFGFAIKATYMEGKDGPKSLFKKPKTDDGIKNSAKGLLMVEELPDKSLVLHEDVSPEVERTGLLQPIFENGSSLNIQTLAQIRSRLESYL